MLDIIIQGSLMINTEGKQFIMQQNKISRPESDNFIAESKKSLADCVGHANEFFRDIHWIHAISVLFGL